MTHVPRAQRLRSAVVGILLALVSAGVPAAVPTSERAALLALYASTQGWAWTNNSNWNGEPGTECTWFGVTRA